MINTKWRELVNVINSNDDFVPLVNIKLIREDSNNGKFSLVWWDEVESDGFRLIEWLDINPIKEEFVGRIVKPKLTDYSKFIENGLKKHTIPYEIDDEISEFMVIRVKHS